MILFRDDDDRYLAFLSDSRNRTGFVINTTRQPTASYLALHRASCQAIQGVPANGRQWTTGSYCKVWASGARELLDWAAQEVQGVPRPCGICRPLSSVPTGRDINADGTGQGLAEQGPTDLQVELVLQLASEGGGETIFRRRTEDGWVYWSDGSTMDLDANDVDHWRTWRHGETRHLGGLLPSALPFLSPLRVHPEYRDWLREVHRCSQFVRDRDGRSGPNRRQPRFNESYWNALVGWVDYPSFHLLYSPDPEGKATLYQALVHMDGGSFKTLSILEGVLRTCKTAEEEVDAMFFDPNWEVHLVAAAAVGLGVVSDKTLSALWRNLDRGSLVGPQLAAVASLADNDFEEKAKRRLTDNSPIPSTSDPGHGDPKGLPALLALCLQRPGSSVWASEFSAHYHACLMLARDRDNSGRTATDWLDGFVAARDGMNS